MRLFQGIHVVAYGCDAAQLEIWERQVRDHGGTLTRARRGDAISNEQLRAATHVVCATLPPNNLILRCEAFRKPLPLLKTDWLAASLHYERLVWTKFYHWNLAVRVSKMIRKRTVSAPCSNSRLSSLNFENDISPRTRIKRNRPASFTGARRVTNRQGGEISSPFCNPSSSSSSGRYVGKLPVVLTWNANNLRARLVGLGGKGGSSVGVGGGGEGLKDLAILHNVDIICIQEVCMDITALQRHLSPLPSSSGAAPTRESDLSTRSNNNGRTSSERMQITPPRRRRVQHRQGEGGDEVSIRRIAPELSSANYIIETRSAPYWLPEDFRMSVWSLNGDEDNKGKAKGKGVGVIMRSSWAPENFERALGFSLDDPELESHARFSEGRCITLQLREELVLLVTYSPQDSFNTCRSCSAIDMLEGGHGGIGTSERRKLLNQSQIPCFRTQVWDRALRKYISSLLSEPRKKHLIWCGVGRVSRCVKIHRVFCLSPTHHY